MSKPIYHENVKLSVTIEFERVGLGPLPPFTKKQKEEITDNVLNGLIEQANHAGIAPEDGDAFTRKITVRAVGGSVSKETSYKF